MTKNNERMAENVCERFIVLDRPGMSDRRKVNAYTLLYASC